MLDITFYWTLERNGCLHLSINFLKRACEVEGQPITGVDGECGSWIRSSFVQRVAWFYSSTSRRYPVDAQWARYDGSSSQLYFCISSNLSGRTWRSCWYPLWWWQIPSEDVDPYAVSDGTTEGLLLHEDIPPKHSTKHRRGLRKHTEEGLEIQFRTTTYPSSELMSWNLLFRL